MGISDDCVASWFAVARLADQAGFYGTKGLPDPVAMKEARRSCFLSMAAGEQDLVTDDIQQLTGIRPFAVDRHALNYPENFGWSA